MLAREIMRGRYFHSSNGKKGTDLFIAIDLIIGLPDRMVKLCPGLQIPMHSARNCLHIRRCLAN